MKKWRRPIVIIAIILGAFVLGGFVIGFVYQDKVKDYVLTEINRQLDAEMTVRSVDFSVFTNFPHAALLLKEVQIHTADKGKQDTLLQLERITLQFDIWEIYQGRYQLDQLELEGGRIRLHIDAKGNDNFSIWHSDTTADSSDFQLNLQSYLLRDVDFSYQNKQKDLLIELEVHDMAASGNFEAATFQSDIVLSSTIVRITEGKTDWIKKRSFEFDGRIDVSEEKYAFEDSRMQLEQLPLSIEGHLENNEKGLKSVIQLSSQGIQLRQAVSLFPPPFKQSLNPYDIDGKVNIKGSINGPWSTKLSPRVALNFEVKKGAFEHRSSNIKLENIELSGKLDNGKFHNLTSTALAIEAFQADFGKGAIKGQLNLNNFNRPKFELNANWDFWLEELAEFADLENILEPKGHLIADIKTAGRLTQIDSLSAADWKRATTSGQITGENISFQVKGRPQQFQNIQLACQLKNNSVDVKSLQVEVSQSDFSIQGKFNNLIAYLLYPNEKVLIDADLNSQRILLDELLLSDESEAAADENYKLEFSDRLTCFLDCRIDSLSFQKFGFRQCQANLVLKNQSLSASNVKFLSMDGKVNGNIQIKERANGQLAMSADAKMRRINIQQLFHDFGNFGQSTLKDENISGKASADIKFSSLWSNELEMNPSSLIAEADLEVVDGALHQFKPLYALSKYVALEELETVTFSKLNNQILIRDRRIFIPRFDVKSSALDVTLEGTHSFENDINYRIVLLMSQLLGKKAKKPDEEFGYIEDDGLGRSKLFLHMSGKVDDPTIKYDTKQLKEHWSKELREEKKELKGILKEEFGMFKKDTSVSVPEKEENTTAPMQIEWEEMTEDPAAKEEEEKQKEKTDNEKKSGKKSKFGKFIDKIAQPNEEEYEESEDFE